MDVRAPAVDLHAAMSDLVDLFKLVAELEKIRRLPRGDAISTEYDRVFSELAPMLAGTSWRRHYYSFLIVKLYSIHERFVRDLVENTTRFFAHIYRDYAALPQKFRKEHLLMTVKHLQDLAEQKNFDHEKFQQNMWQLDECLGGVVRLNDHVMSRHTSNFRSETVKLVVGRLGIVLSDAELDEEWSVLLEGVLSGVYSTVNSVIDDLANRRNEVAHGSDFEILDLETLRAIADAVYGYDCWLLQRIARSLLTGLVEREATEIGNVDHVWKDKISGEKTVARLLDVNEIMSTNFDVYLRAQQILPCVVREIQRDGDRILEATPSRGPFGVHLSIACHAGNKILRIPGTWRRAEQALLAGITEKPEFKFTLDFDRPVVEYGMPQRPPASSEPTVVSTSISDGDSD